MNKYTPKLFLMAFVLGCLMVAAPLQAAPKSDLWERRVSHDPDSTIAVDHNPWEILLAKYVYPHEDGINRVAYDAVHLIDQKALDQYIASLSVVKVSTLNRNEQQAYWINLYNALTVQVILDKYLVPSIRNIDISPGFFSDGPWDKALVQIEGKDITLNDIEHRILRPIWKDPRIHYALNCASLGCPNQTSGLHAYGVGWENNAALFHILLAGLTLAFDSFGLFDLDAGRVLRTCVGLTIILIALGLNVRASIVPGDPQIMARRIILVIAALLLLGPTMYPWYYTWMVPFLAILPLRSMLIFSAVLPLYRLQFHPWFMENSWVFQDIIVWLEQGPVLILLALECRREWKTDRARSRNNRYAA